MIEFEPRLRVLFACSGVGIMNRGIETFFREAFDGLKGTEGLHVRLLKGAGFESADERVVWNLPRTGLIAQWLGELAQRNGYVIEQWSSLPSVARQIRAFRPHVVFYSDANLGFLLFRLRSYIGTQFRLLFSNGGPVHPPFVRTDFVHQIAPTYYHEAILAGEPAVKHFMVPYGINMIQAPKPMPQEERNTLRRKLALPVDRLVILSVGWVRRNHKRMDYVIEEVARLPRPRPFLQLLGATDKGSTEILHQIGRAHV
jgi:1,2-diacylglycerol 3-alpha-glucosyltransferase